MCKVTELSNFFVLINNAKIMALEGMATSRQVPTMAKPAPFCCAVKLANKDSHENRTTIFMNSNYSKETIQTIILAVAECNSVRGTARIFKLDKDGVNRVVLKAGEHCKKVLENLITDLCLNECQLDELWSFVKKRKLFSTKTSSRSMAATGSGQR
jgi:hypothetical protein